MREMIIKYKILKFIKPLVIVSSLKGTGENPAIANKVIQAITPPSEETLSFKNEVSSDGGVIAWITLLAIAGFSPVPFKLLTITSGFINFNIFYFIIISLLTRGSRFFLIAFLVGNFGPTMKKIIEKKLLKFSILLSVILIIFAYFIYKFLNNFIN